MFFKKKYFFPKNIKERGDYLKKRIALKQFRVGLQLTQQEMADKLGVHRMKYAAIENGQRHGTFVFWSTFQNVFEVPDENMWKLQKTGVTE